MCVCGSGATQNGRPAPFAAQCAVGPKVAYCASYAGSTPIGTTPGPITGLCATRAGIMALEVYVYPGTRPVSGEEVHAFEVTTQHPTVYV